MRRNAPVVIVAVGLLTLLEAFVWYSQSVLTNLRSEARQTAGMYAQLVVAISDTTRDPSARTAIEADLIQSLERLRVPVILTDRNGKVQASSNLPFDDPIDSPHVRAYADTLDSENPPVPSEYATIHIGNTALIRGMR